MLDKITFKRPRFKNISEEGYTAVDMHLHSEYSDSRTKVKNILRKAEKKGFGVSIADHNEIRGSLKALEQKEVLVIPGIEVTSLEGFHLLFYFYQKDELEEFYEKFVNKYKSKNPMSRINRNLNTLLNDAMDYNCVTCLPHPFAYLWTNIKSKTKDMRRMRFFKKIHAVEVLNGEVNRLRNLNAIELAIKAGKSYTAGSDGHMLIEIGTVVTLSKNNTVEGFLNSIKKKKNLVVGREKNLINRIAYHAPGINRHLKHMPTNIKYAYNHTYKKKIEDIGGKIRKGFSK
ncbi:PHP domain-containing protein [Candidatus Woesearchaeota archaeon]|nr:PHP domain-containing protein [Candidatus Woesearchaeota archaeon]